MGTRGPKPKSAAEVELNGNPGRRTPRADVLAQPLETPPDPPESLPAVARPFWRSFAADLVARKLLAKCDLPALRLLCQAWADYETAVEDISANGASGITDKGYEFPRPAVQRQNQATAQILSISARFGLTPADRVGLGDRQTKTPTVSPLVDQTGDNGDPPPPAEVEAEGPPVAAPRAAKPKPKKTRGRSPRSR